MRRKKRVGKEESSQKKGKGKKRKEMEG